MAKNRVPVLAIVGVCVTLAGVSPIGGSAVAAAGGKGIGMTSGGGNKGVVAPDQPQPCPDGKTPVKNPTGKQDCAARAGVMPYVGGLRSSATAPATKDQGPPK